jgi:hypothetical protein
MPHVCSRPLAAFAEPPTTPMTILDIRTDFILDSDVWEFDTLDLE